MDIKKPPSACAEGGFDIRFLTQTRYGDDLVTTTTTTTTTTETARAASLFSSCDIADFTVFLKGSDYTGNWRRKLANIDELVNSHL